MKFLHDMYADIGKSMKCSANSLRTMYQEAYKADRGIRGAEVNVMPLLKNIAAGDKEDKVRAIAKLKEFKTQLDKELLHYGRRKTDLRLFAALTP